MVFQRTHSSKTQIKSNHSLLASQSDAKSKLDENPIIHERAYPSIKTAEQDFCSEVKGQRKRCQRPDKTLQVTFVVKNVNEGTHQWAEKYYLKCVL